MILSQSKIAIERLRHGLKYDMGDIIPALSRFVAFALRKLGVAQENKRLLSSRGYIEHYGVHMPRNNAGDTVLFDAVERLFDEQTVPSPWRKVPVRKQVTAEDVARINAQAKAVLVGGGGLFIADSNPDSLSGWQWNIAVEDLRQMEAPLVLFAVGFNQFRGGETFAPIFQEHLELTMDKACFVGLRNSGSQQRLINLLPEKYHAKLSFQPCMTTVLNRYYRPAEIYRKKLTEKTVVLNLAFDRREQRFGTDEAIILDRIGKALKRIVGSGWKIRAAVHAWDDDAMVEFLREQDIPAEICRLNLSKPEDVVKFYADARLTIGMRGHSQMIPFGCGRSIFSLISHDKMRFFLEDIEQPGWGVEVSDIDLEAKIVQFVEEFPVNEAEFEEKIRLKQDQFWAVTQSNMKTIHGHLA